MSRKHIRKSPGADHSDRGERRTFRPGRLVHPDKRVVLSHSSLHLVFGRLSAECAPTCGLKKNNTGHTRSVGHRSATWSWRGESPAKGQYAVVPPLPRWTAWTVLACCVDDMLPHIQNVGAKFPDASPDAPPRIARLRPLLLRLLPSKHPKATGDSHPRLQRSSAHCTFRADKECPCGR